MNILFLTLVPIRDLQTGGIYHDLCAELAARGHNIVVASPAERREGLKTSLYYRDGVRFLRVRTLNNTKVGLAEKALALLTTPLLLERAVRKLLKGEGFDLILYSTPPLTIASVVKRLKKKYEARTYLMLKDIWPQTGVDLGALREGELSWRYLALKERLLLCVSDKIGCMSPGNMEYVKNRRPECADKLEVLPNALKLMPKLPPVPHEKLTLVYGGSFGAPQGVDFIIKVLEYYQDRQDLKFILVGAGTEYKHVEITVKDIPSVQVLPMLPRDEYFEMLRSADIGLVFLSNRFTVPNMPSRTLDYMLAGLPVLAAVDAATDFSSIIETGGFGLSSVSGDIEAFDRNLQKLTDETTRRAMGEAGRKYLEDNWTVGKACDIILNDC